jgi:hypothetical protein
MAMRKQKAETGRFRVGTGTTLDGVMRTVESR